MKCRLIKNPDNLVSDLRRRATTLRNDHHLKSDQTDADYMDSAAIEIERLRQALASPSVIEVEADEAALTQLLERAGIPVIVEIHPRADAALGHVFTWPREEVEQLRNGER